MLDEYQFFYKKFCEEWTDLQLIFWEARRQVETKQENNRHKPYEICRDSHSCYVRKRGYIED